MNGISTKLIHGADHGDCQLEHRSLKTPIYQAASYDFEDSESIEQAFLGNKDAFVYSRVSNPTVRELENRLKVLAGAEYSLCVSSGMAAISATILAICDSGDNIVTSRYLFGNTYSLFVTTFKSFGIDVRFADLNDTEDIASQIDDNTRAIFMEVITNPQLFVFDVERISTLAKKKKVLLIVDNSLLSPYIFECRKYGVDVEVTSTTKFISGGATSVGGAIFTYESDKWSHIPKLKENAEKFGQGALHKKLTKEVYRNLGCCLSPQNAFLQLLGLETLTLRIDKICDNATLVSEWMEDQPLVQGVEYSALQSSPYFTLAQTYFGGKAGCLICFQLKDKNQCFKFMDALKVIKRGTNFCDNKSMIIHPSSTIYCELNDEEKEALCIDENAMRLGVGLEDVQDVIDDISQALSLL